MAVSNPANSSSTLNPSVCIQGANAVGSKLAINVSQDNHGFSFGSAVRWNSGIDGNTAEYVAAKANNAYNAEVVGVVSDVISDSAFELTLAGTVRMNKFFNNSTGTIPQGFTADDVFFLSGYTAGWMDVTRPTSPGWVAKPVVTRLAEDAQGNIFGMVTNYVGSLLGGTVAVSLGEVSPVGTIQGYLGVESRIPNGWALCNGNGHSSSTPPGLPIASHSEYYTSVGRRYGWVEKIKTDMTPANVSVGDYIYHSVDGREIAGTIVHVDPDATTDGNYVIYVKQSPDNIFDTDAEGAGEIFQQRNGNFMTTTEVRHRGGDNTLNTVRATKQSLYNFASASNNEITFTRVSSSDGNEAVYHSYEDSSINTGVYSVLVPDLRGKFLLGADAATDDPDVNEKHHLGLSGGSEKFDLKFTDTDDNGVHGEGTGILGTNEGGWAETQTNMPPYMTINWIIRTDTTSYAAILDSISLKDLKLTDLPTSESGDQWTVYRDNGDLKIKTT